MCDSVCVCMCICVCCQSLNSSPPTTSHPPNLTSWQNDSSLAYLNSTHSLSPACWGSHQSSCRTPDPLGCLSEMKPSSCFPSMHLLLPHPPPRGPLLPSCFSELLKWIQSCQARVKMNQPTWNREWSVDRAWINASIRANDFLSLHNLYSSNYIFFQIVETKKRAEQWL